jgi:hypothetical protein
MDFQLNWWANLRILGQPCGFYLLVQGRWRASSRISLVFKRSWRLEQRLAESEPPLPYMDALRRLNDAAEGGRR